MSSVPVAAPFITGLVGLFFGFIGGHIVGSRRAMVKAPFMPDKPDPYADIEDWGDVTRG